MGVNKHDFTNGVPIDEGQMFKWHQEALAEIRKGAKFWVSRSGRGMVVGRNISDELGEEIQIFEIPNGYISYTYFEEKANP